MKECANKDVAIFVMHVINYTDGLVLTHLLMRLSYEDKIGIRFGPSNQPHLLPFV